MNLQPLRWIVVAVLGGIVALIGIDLVLAGAGVDWARAPLVRLADPAFDPLLLGVGAAFIVLVVLLVLAVGDRPESVGTIAFDNPHGTVTIAGSAIRDFIVRMLEEYPQVKVIRSRLQAAEEGVEVVLDVSIQAEGEIPQLLAGIQDRVRTRVRDELGVEAVGSVRVNVTEIISTAPASPRPEIPAVGDGSE